jgi:hypothetical protein
MITVVIGGSGSGKTTFVKSKFLDPQFLITTDIVAVTLVKKTRTAFIGKYGIGIRTEGTDTLSYTAMPRIKRQVEKLDRDGWNVVLEGDRINNRKFFEWLLMKKFDCQLILMTAPLDVCLMRLRLAGSHITKPFATATATKARHMFLTFGSQMKGEVHGT